MGLSVVNVKTANYSGSEIILEHQDVISENTWNKFVESGAASYYQPHTCISENSYDMLIGPTLKSFWGCIPPSNSACDSTYSEKASIWVSLGLRQGVGNCFVKCYGGTNPTALSPLLSQLFVTTGTYESLLVAELDVPYYDTPTGSATPYYFKTTLQAQGSSDLYKLEHLDVSYQKWVNSPIPYEGTATTSFDPMTTGTGGTIVGTDGSGVTIGGTYYGVNVVNWGFNNGTYPYTSKFVEFGAASSYTGHLYSSYGGDTTPSSVYDYTRFSSSLRLHVGTGDGNLVTNLVSFVEDSSGTKNVDLEIWNSSGTTYGKISSAAFTCGATGTTFTLGSWVGAGTTGFLHTSITAIDDDGTQKQMSWYFSLSSYGLADKTVTVTFANYDAVINTAYKVFYETTQNPVSPIGILLQNGEWTL